jgi:hypothetical protein
MSTPPQVERLKRFAMPSQRLQYFIGTGILASPEIEMPQIVALLHDSQKSGFRNAHTAT